MTSRGCVEELAKNLRDVWLHSENYNCRVFIDNVETNLRLIAVVHELSSFDFKHHLSGGREVDEAVRRANGWPIKFNSTGALFSLSKQVCDFLRQEVSNAGHLWHLTNELVSPSGRKTKSSLPTFLISAKCHGVQGGRKHASRAGSQSPEASGTS